MDPEFTFPDADALADAVADRVVEMSRSAIRARRRFVVALSGGRTTLPIYRRLGVAPCVSRIDWRRTHVLFADERCVPPEHPLSNYRAIRDALLGGVPIPARCVHRVEAERTPVAAADLYEIVLRALLGRRAKIDLAVLGVGVDGHIASLFPGHRALDEMTRWAVPVCVPVRPPWRVTMTLPLLRRTRQILFVVCGEEKTAVYQRLSSGDDLPAARLRRVDPPPIWYVSPPAPPSPHPTPVDRGFAPAGAG